MQMNDTGSSKSSGSTGINTSTPGVPGMKTGLEIAVIGMAGRFPGAKNINQFWENLKNGIESLSFLTNQDLEDSGLPENLLEDPNYVRTRGGVLENKDYFDASFFDYTPLEAELLNPQTRIFYECSWEALENAAYNPLTADQVIGIYAGAEPGFYWEALAALSGKTNALGEFTTGLLTRENNLCTRVSYHLNLKGPALAVQTACSTSLAAIHIACQALLNGECNIALAGGVTVLVMPGDGYLYQEGMVMSPDGHCRAFDARAKGMACGEGCGIVVLKLLDQAINDNDFIHALVKGTAINNDGIRKIGYTAPSVLGQAEVIKIAQKVAEVEPESITYVETHGTGTVLGDPIEIQALKQAFNTNKKQYCAVGSVKSNVGHLGSAAGVTGFIKTVLALKHRLIPPSLHFETPNPGIPFENSPFYVNTKLQPWKNEKYPLRAGVSSFGIGGTNAHVILEEAPEGTRGLAPLPGEKVPGQARGGVSPPEKSREYQLILLSAKTESALDKMTENLAEYFRKNLLNHGNHKNPTNPGPALADAAYTLQVGRQAFQNRKMLVCSTGEEAGEILSTPASQQVYTGQVQDENPPVIFVFSGLGGQYVNMGRDLYEKEPLFRKEMDRCFKILKPLIDEDIKEILYPGDSVSEVSEVSKESSSVTSVTSVAKKINQTEIAQVVVFIFEYALAKLLMKWGIKPYAMIGYSFGEYTAACIAGLFSLADALELVTARAQLLRKIPNGVMLSVPLAKEELISFLPANLSLAIDNGPSCVVAGTPETVAAFEKEVKARKCLTMRLQAPHAVHSYMMDPVLKEFEKAAARITWQEPVIPYISNVTGDWIDLQQVSAPAYWAKHLRETVCFAQGLHRLLKEPNAVFVEIGPGRDIRTLVTRALEINSNNNNRQPHHQRRVINLIRPRDKEIADHYYLLHKIGLLWLLGVSINWQEYYRGEKRYRLPLPTYPFEGHRFWTVVQDYQSKNFQLSTVMSAVPVPGKPRELADWFYVPLWKRQKILHVNTKGDTGSGKANLCWWVFVDDFGLGERLVEGLNQDKNQQHSVITIQIGPDYKKQNSFLYTVNPTQYEDYQTLLAELASLGSPPHRIVHLWGITRDNGEGIEPHSIEKYNDLGFYSLLYLAKALSQNRVYTGEIGINVVTNHMQSVTGDEHLSPGKATVLGPCRVIPQEYPGITCKSIDISQWQNQEVLQRLMEEVKLQNRELVVAYRGKQRWVQTFEAVQLEEQEVSPLLRGKGVYLIIGGLGDIGYTLAEYLIKRVSGKVILTGRSLLPDREMWAQYLNDSHKKDKTYQDIRKLQQLRDSGGEVLYFSADAAHRKAMQEAIQQAEERFGPINGVIHSAGIIRGESFKSIHEITRKECEEQFQAKIYGLMVLEELLQGKPLDFCLVISSLSTVLGGLGFAAYSAANHFMDAFSAKHNQENQVPWIILDWEGTNKQDTVNAFHRIFWSHPLDQVIFSIGGDLQTRISRWLKLEGIHKGPKEAGIAPIRSRPRLLNPYLAPGKPLEKKLAHIWQDFFGIDKIGITDDFFDLGGDSLKMINIISIIQKELKVTIPLKEFFDHPTIKSTARYISGAKEETFISIHPVEKREYYDTSAAQDRLYILQQWEEGSTAYNSPQVLLLKGHFEPERLQQAARTLIHRHESLRTSFAIVSGKTAQRVHDKVKFEIEYYLATENTENTEKQGIHQFIRPFDLSRAPGFRLGLIKTGEAQHILMFDIHHIITDAVSHEIFVRELMALYEGTELSPLPIQYKDYWEWQKKPQQQELLAQQEAFWLAQYQTGEEIPVLVLPYDYPRPRLQSFAGDQIAFELGEKETGALQQIALEQGVTLHMILMTILNIFLFKLSGQEDIVVGTPVAGRRHAELESVIGVFINTLPIRNHPSAGKTMHTFLKEVRETSLQAFENQQYPFENLVEKVVVHRDIGRNPLFDVLFVLQVNQEQPGRTKIPPVKLPGLELYPQEYNRYTSKFDLTLHAAEQGKRLLMHFEYCTRLFKAGTLKRFVQYFKKITAALVNNLHQYISDIDLLSEQEKEQLLRDFNRTKTGYPSNKAIHQLFAEQVEQTPDYIAVIGMHHGPWTMEEPLEGTRRLAPSSELMSITYRELNDKSHQLACRLQEKGVLPDTIAAIMLKPSVEMIVGILAILKAGAAYLPIDPEFPPGRIEYMLNDSDARALVTTPGLSEKFEKSSTVNCQLSIINLQQEIACPVQSNSPLERGGSSTSFKKFGGGGVCLNLQAAANPSNLAYIIYTSGTTGKPKGVLLTHENLVNYVHWFTKMTDLTGNDKTILTSSIAFDLGYTSLYTSILNGGELHILTKEMYLLPEELLDYIKQKGITYLKLTPALFSIIVNSPGFSEEKCKTLRLTAVGGEAINVEDIEKAHFICQHLQIMNHYGPTEATIGCVATFVDFHRFEEYKSHPVIGKPIHNTNVYILGKDLNVLPAGVPGELCISGTCLARGYLNRPALTAEKFDHDLWDYQDYLDEKLLRGVQGGGFLEKSP
ncbi:MAG: SDR family NAD(P)-dependent oxidoreductase, partial [Candidatus Aminicenantes bacterium]